MIICRSCGNELHDDAANCDVCYDTLEVFSAPDGFDHMPSTKYYFRIEYDEGGKPQRTVVFNANTGEYKYVSDPAAGDATTGEQPSNAAAPSASEAYRPSGPKFCVECGTPVSGSGKFCVECGIQLR